MQLFWRATWIDWVNLKRIWGKNPSVHRPKKLTLVGYWKMQFHKFFGPLWRTNACLHAAPPPTVYGSLNAAFTVGDLEYFSPVASEKQTKKIIKHSHYIFFQSKKLAVMFFLIKYQNCKWYFVTIIVLTYCEKKLF